MFWTVAIEFQLYLVFPFLVLIAKAQGILGIARLVLIAIVLRVVALIMKADVHYLSYWTVLGRVDQFLIGMIAAHVFSASSRNVSLLAFTGAWAAALATIGLYHRLGGWPVMSWWKLLWPTIEGILWAGVIYVMASSRFTLFSRLRRAFQAIGRISYSIYLLHMVVIQIILAQELFLQPFESGYYNALATALVIVLPLTLALSALTYNGLEKPFLNMRRRYKADPIAKGTP